MQLGDFLQTLRVDILEEDDYTQITDFADDFVRLAPKIKCLERAHDVEDVEDCLESYSILHTFRRLFGLDPRLEDRKRIIELIWNRILQLRELVGEQLTPVLVGSQLQLADAPVTLSQRRIRKFEQLVEKGLLSFIDAENLIRDQRLPGAANIRFDYVVYDNGAPLLAVKTSFQSTRSGRQEADLISLLQLQQALHLRQIGLLYIADGLGFRAPQVVRILQKVAPELHGFTNLYGLDTGELEIVFKYAYSLRTEPPSVNSFDNELVLALLQRGQSVTASIISRTPDRDNTAENFLRFLVEHPEYDLLLDENGTLRAQAADAILNVNRLLNSVNRREKVDLELIIPFLKEKLEYRFNFLNREKTVTTYEIELPISQIALPSKLPIFVPSLQYNMNKEKLFEYVYEFLNKLGTQFGLLFDPVNSSISRDIANLYSKQQRAQITVISGDDVIEILLRTRVEAQNHLLNLILQSVDLSLVSPFISEGPTPENMFYGREPEIRRIREQIGRKSFALIGGRKVGKTSILNHLHRHLSPIPSESIDCYAKVDRLEFLRDLIHRTSIGAEVTEEAHLLRAEHIILSFIRSRFNDGAGVLLLDEVDRLFVQDSVASEHPHLLSRALRALSQSGNCTLVITGERGLYELTKDPTSPHWNFCVPIIIGPLSENAARALLSHPLAALNIHLTDDSLNIALERTVQHPNLLQALGDKLVSDLAKNRSIRGEKVYITTEKMDLVTSTPEFRSTVVSTFLGQASDVEKIISYHLKSHEPVKLEQLIDLFAANGCYIDGAVVQSALEYLKLYAIAEEHNSGFTYTVPIFDSYFRPYSSELTTKALWRKLRETYPRRSG